MRRLMGFVDRRRGRLALVAAALEVGGILAFVLGPALLGAVLLVLGGLVWTPIALRAEGVRPSIGPVYGSLAEPWRPGDVVDPRPVVERRAPER